MRQGVLGRRATCVSPEGASRSGGAACSHSALRSPAEQARAASLPPSPARQPSVPPQLDGWAGGPQERGPCSRGEPRPLSPGAGTGPSTGSLRSSWTRSPEAGRRTRGATGASPRTTQSEGGRACLRTGVGHGVRPGLPRPPCTPRPGPRPSVPALTELPPLGQPQRAWLRWSHW